MKAFVDPSLCIGCTQCAGLCPEVYAMEGTLAVALPRPAPSAPSASTHKGKTRPKGRTRGARLFCCEKVCGFPPAAPFLCYTIS